MYLAPGISPAETLSLPSGPYATLATTILAELIPTPSTALPSPHTPSPEIDPLLAPHLSTVGYTGPISDHAAVTAFLLSTLQTHRMLTHHTHRNHAADEDTVLAQGVSDIYTCLDLAPAHVEGTFDMQSLAHTIESLQSTVEVRALVPSTGLIQSDESLTQMQMSKLGELTDALKKEHVTRVSMLLTRLKVTVDAFARSPRADVEKGVFESVRERVEEMERDAENCQAVSVYDALTAREWILEERRRKGSEIDVGEVKGFVMGAVPDRGGRLGHVSEMPRFRGRVGGKFDGGSGGRGKGRHKGKKRKGKSQFLLE